MSAATFWLLLTLACVAWYTSITLYIAWRGAFDIRQMLQRLSESNDAAKKRGPLDT